MAFKINNRVYDWVTATWTLSPPIGRSPVSIMSCTYPEHGIEKTLTYAQGFKPIGHTRDTYKPTQLEIEFLIAEWDDLRSKLGSRYMLVEIPAITITYADEASGLSPRTDVFERCHVTKENITVSQGTDPAKIKVTFQPDEMVLNGVRAV